MTEAYTRYTFTCELKTRTCSCQSRKEFAIPCRHLVFVAESLKAPFLTLFDERYRTANWKAMHECLLDLPELNLDLTKLPPKNNFLPAIYGATRGRKKKERVVSHSGIRKSRSTANIAENPNINVEEWWAAQEKVAQESAVQNADSPSSSSSSSSSASLNPKSIWTCDACSHQSATKSEVYYKKEGILYCRVCELPSMSSSPSTPSSPSSDSHFVCLRGCNGLEGFYLQEGQQFCRSCDHPCVPRNSLTQDSRTVDSTAQIPTVPAGQSIIQLLASLKRPSIGSVFPCIATDPNKTRFSCNAINAITKSLYCGRLI